MKKIFLPALLATLCGPWSVAWADGALMMKPIPKLVDQECASCHMVYPPALLPQASWQRIFSNLNQHYGVDASLDSKTTSEVAQWFTSQAGTYKRVNTNEIPEQDRITKSKWFVRKHHEVTSSVWQRPSIKSAANCVACHGPGATKGNFDDDEVRIPK
jgi:mono/diheme cytochrome c family protein